MYNQITYGPHNHRKNPLFYIRTKESMKQDVSNQLNQMFNEHEKIKQTLNKWFDCNNPDSAFSQLSKKFSLDKNTSTKISMLNYWNTEIIYLVNFWWKWEVVACINQPITPFWKIKQEYENLKRLHDLDTNYIVNPLAFFADEKTWYAFYVTEYIKDAICIAHDQNWNHGFYNPLPSYHFECIDSEVSKQLNIWIIALLVHYYDKEKWLWISETEISWNDFLLTKEFDPKQLESIKDSIKLLAARNSIHISLNEYLDLIRKEFIVWTNRTDNNMSINKKSVCWMTWEDIEKWIELWINLINSNPKKTLNS